MPKRKTAETKLMEIFYPGYEKPATPTTRYTIRLGTLAQSALSLDATAADREIEDNGHGCFTATRDAWLRAEDELADRYYGSAYFDDDPNAAAGCKRGANAIRRALGMEPLRPKRGF